MQALDSLRQDVRFHLVIDLEQSRLKRVLIPKSRAPKEGSNENLGYLGNDTAAGQAYPRRRR